MIDKPIKEHGFPLKGTGYAWGVNYLDGKTYIDFVMTSSYQAHIRVQCDEKWEYVPNGDIIFPPSWDTEEKRGGAVLKGYRTGLNKERAEKGQEGKQMSIFDFME